MLKVSSPVYPQGWCVQQQQPVASLEMRRRRRQAGNKGLARPGSLAQATGRAWAEGEAADSRKVKAIIVWHQRGGRARASAGA